MAPRVARLLSLFLLVDLRRAAPAHCRSDETCTTAPSASSYEEADEEGFVQTRRVTASKKVPADSALVVIDMQNDFISPSGSLAGGGHEDLVPIVNKVIKGANWSKVVFTGDYHPGNHVSFNTFYPSYKESIDNGPFDIQALSYSNYTVDDGPKLCGAEYAKRYGEAGNPCIGFPDGKAAVYEETGVVYQETYPPHCVQGTWGQRIVPELDFTFNEDTLILKGFTAHIDSYSAIFNNIACIGESAETISNGLAACIPQEPFPRETNLPEVLKSAGIKNVYFVGICFDYCVKFSAIHAAFLDFNTYVIKDATVSCGTTSHASNSHKAMEDHGVHIVEMKDCAF